MQKQLTGTISKMHQLVESSAALAKSGVAMMTFGREITEAVLSPVLATFETRRAIGELVSLGVQDLNRLEDSAKQFSDTWAGTVKSDFIAAAYDIKSGISSLSDEGIAEYTKIAGITATATKATTEQMTSLFASGYGIYKGFYADLSDIEFAEVFSAGISESVRAFKTSGSGMADSIQALGAQATSANVPLEEQLAILGMMQATMSGSEAGTKYRAFIKSAAKAANELGLVFTDTNNQLLSMPEILSTLKSKFGETIDAAEAMELQKAFGTDEAVALINLLYDKTGDLQGNILNLYSAMGQGISVASEMAETINQEPGQQYEVLLQQFKNLKEQLGEQLLPTFIEWMKSGKDMVQNLSEWIENNQSLVRVLMTLALYMGVAITTIGGFSLVLGTVGMVVGKVMITFSTLRKAFLALKTGAMLFSGALLTNPITWIVVGVLALVVALYLLYKNWDAIVAFLTSTWNSTVEWIVTGFDWIRNKIADLPFGFQLLLEAIFPFIGVPMLIINHWSSIREFFSTLWASITMAFQMGIDGVKNFLSTTFEWFRSSGERVMTTFTDGIKSMISRPVEAVQGALSKIRQMLPFSDAKTGPLSTLTLSGKRVFSTIVEGMDQTKDLPAEMTHQAFRKMQMVQEDEMLSFGVARTPDSVKSEKPGISLESKASKDLSAEQASGITIHNLTLHVDNIRELSDLIKFIESLKELGESGGNQ